MIETQTLSFNGHVPVEATRSVHMLPFIVPEDTGRIEISYHCDSDLSFGLEPDENPHDYFADFAIFDPQGAEFMGKGFRGTSGNSRTTIFISPDDATPGYTPGELYTGEWQIMLGFYKVAPTGCDYQVSIKLTAGSSHPTTTVGARLPLRTESNRSANATGWYKGDLHSHTYHSDGDSDPRDVVKMAETLGLDFLSITDHNIFSQQIVMNQIDTPVMLIPGCEVTTAYGHWNIWGDGPWIDFRVTTEAEMEETIRQAKQVGYLTSCNHPRPNGPPWRFPEVEGYQCVEAWNGGWWDNNDTCLNFWEVRLNAGERLVAVGGSDCHELTNPNAGRLAAPTTYIYCEGDPSPAAIIDGLRHGHAFITCDPNGPQLYLSGGSAIMGDAVEIPASGPLPITVHVTGGSGMQLEIRTAQGLIEKQMIADNDISLDFAIDTYAALYVRAQLKDLATNYVTALTNPIFLGIDSTEGVKNG